MATELHAHLSCLVAESPNRVLGMSIPPHCGTPLWQRYELDERILRCCSERPRKNLQTTQGLSFTERKKKNMLRGPEDTGGKGTQTAVSTQGDPVRSSPRTSEEAHF